MRLIIVFFILALSGCGESPPVASAPPSLFSTNAPVHPRFRDELKYIEAKGLLTPAELNAIESSIATSAQAFAVPQPVVWCLLFQESRFDRLKNLVAAQGAKGLGQFTPNALEEINVNTGFYNKRTPSILAKLKQTMPITFEYKLGKKKRSPKVPDRSYFQEQSGVTASTAFLMNRYQQLSGQLDRIGVKYHPEVVWIYSIAAYNKGARTIHMLLRFQLRHGGIEWLSQIMSNPELTFRILKDESFLTRSFKYIWNGTKKQQLYARELALHMKSFEECAIRGEDGV